MKIGHLFWQPIADVNNSHVDRLRETEKLVDLCEEHGFWGVSFGENHFSNYGLSPNPILLAVGLGRRTRRLNISTGIAVLPFWNPIRLAEDAATADLLLDGRFELGVGRGYQCLEFEGLNVPIGERQARFDEALDIMLRAWTQPEVEHSGQYYHVPRAVNVLPKSLTKPHPRLYVATSTEESVRAAAHYDFKVFAASISTASEVSSNRLIYLDERKRLGKVGDFFTPAMNRQVYVVDSSDPAKIEEARESVVRRGLALFRFGIGLKRGTIRYEAGQIFEDPLPGEPDPETVASRAIFGSPDMVIEQLLVLRDEVGVEEFNVMTEHGFLSFDEARRSVELIGKEVIPALEAQAPPAKKSGEAGSPREVETDVVKE